jgi:hypothetical protein
MKVSDAKLKAEEAKISSSGKSGKKTVGKKEGEVPVDSAPESGGENGNSGIA